MLHQFTATFRVVVLLTVGVIFLPSFQASAFVQVTNGQFTINGKPYYYMGTNFWYGAILGSKGKDGNRQRLLRELDLMKKSGITNVRVMIGAEGPEDEVHRVQPSLQVEPGKYNEELLDGLDFLLAEMGKRKMYAILFLNNSWDWSGGYGQYLEWNGFGEALCIREPENSWNQYQAFNGQFYSCEPCIAQYHNHIRFILGRTNAYSHTKYTDDPAIMAWEIGNEPRPFGNQNIPAFEKMISGTAVLIKSIDQNHLLTIGSEGEMGCEGSMALFERIHTPPEIDYLTMHIWPLNWSWVRQNNIAATFDQALVKTSDYMARHVAVAEKLHKPIVVEEFGLPRDNYGFQPTDSDGMRSRYYENIFKAVAEHSKSNGVMAGVNFWTWSGLGRPSRVWYQRGDEYLGDPPCEEQGVNSVYSTDSTLLTIIKYAKEINR